MSYNQTYFSESIRVVRSAKRAPMNQRWIEHLPAIHCFFKPTFRHALTLPFHDPKRRGPKSGFLYGHACSNCVLVIGLLNHLYLRQSSLCSITVPHLKLSILAKIGVITIYFCVMNFHMLHKVIQFANN